MAVKHYLKHSDTCACVYVQTHDAALEVGGAYNPAAWGAVESYTAPTGRVLTTVRCAVHAAVPITVLNTVLLDRECRRANRAVTRLLTNAKFNGKTFEDVRARAVFSGDVLDRTVTLSCPELTTAERTALQAAIADSRVVLVA